MKLILAPMATLTHEPLRRTIAKFGGCDEYYTEMIHSASLIHNGQFEKYYLLTGPEPEKIVWQLTGTDADSFAKATSVVSALGGIGVDINMGCSAPEIYKYGAGIAWMLKPREETLKMVAGVRASLPSNMRLSVKLRLGDEDFTEDGLFEFANQLINEGVTQFTLHPRTRKEKYTRPARWQYLKSFSEHVKNSLPKKNTLPAQNCTLEQPQNCTFEQYSALSVIGNGSVSDVSSFMGIQKAAPLLDGVMIGRAAIQKPWIFHELAASTSSTSLEQMQNLANFIDCNLQEKNHQKKPLKIDLFEIAEEFTANLEIYQPKEFYETRSRRFFAFYLDNFTFGNHLKNKITNTSIRSEQLAFLDEYLEKMPQERYKIL